MNNGIVFIKRYGPPGNLDTAPYGTICQVDNEQEMDIYIQVSPEEETPKWERMGTYPQSYNKIELSNEAEKFKSLKF